MTILIHLLFFLIWVFNIKGILTPITLFIPFSFKIEGLAKNKKYLLSTIISILPIIIAYVSSASSYEFLYFIIIPFLAIIPLFLITLVVIYLISFLDYYLENQWNNDIISKAIFYLLYLSYITFLYFASDKVVSILYRLVKNLL